ncbi:MAG: PilZ domain-containing protein [Myxococcales bacterium]|nr:PilZ domain-containing protein [Myxococcales bacterium]
MASPDDMAEFRALSVKVSAKTASERERARWRELRTILSKPRPAPQPPQIARQHARAQKKLKVEFAPLASLHATFTEEISPGGIKVRVHGHVDTGAMMIVRLELGEPGPLTLSARVVWCKRDGGHYFAGLEFVGLRDDERERIEAWTALASARPSKART